MNYIFAKLFLLSVLIFPIHIFADTKTTPVSLNEEEKAWLDDKPYLTVLTLQNFFPFAFLEEGQPVGYANEVVKIMGQMLGKEIRFMTKPWNEQLQMLQEGTLDFIPYIVINEERKKYIDFTDFDYITFNIGFTTKQNRRIEKMRDLKGKKIAVVKKYFLHDHLKQAYPEIPLLVTNSTQESIEAVAQNQAYAALDNVAAMEYLIREGWHNQLKIAHADDLGLPYTNRLHMGVAKGNKHLKSILEKAYAALPGEEIRKLQRKWLNAHASAFLLTQQEKAYLESKPCLSVMSLENFQPFSFRKNGEPMGYSIEMMQMIGEMIGKEIRFVKEPWNEQLKMLQEGTLDVIPHLAVTEERKAFADYTDFIHITFLTGFAIPKEFELTSMKDLGGKTLAVVEGYYLQRHLEKHFPEIKLLPSKSTEEAIQAVARGKADAFIDNISTINHFIQEKWLNNLKIANVDDLGLPMETKMPMGVPKGSRYLKSILEKAHAALPQEKLVQLKKKWMSDSTSVSSSKVILTQEENEFLRSHPVIRVGESSDFEPELIKNPDGTLSGIVPDFYGFLGKQLGVKFEIVDDKWPKILERMEKRDIDIIAQMNEDVAKKRGWQTFPAPYRNIVTAFARRDRQFELSQDADIRGLRVAYYKEILFLKKYFDERQDQMEVIEADGVMQAMEMLIENKADIMIGFNHDSYLLTKNMLSGIEPMYVFKEISVKSAIAS